MIDLIQSIKNAVYKATGYDNEKHNSFRNPFFILLALIVSGFVFLAYSNHFSNDFQFDDAHTIQNNYAIREVNIKKFFSDGTTFSSLPSNQSYRPYITSENAIDYKLGGGLNVKTFHIHIFITFLLVCILLCVFVKQMLDRINFSNYNQFWGLLVGAVFGLLCANAETVNYVIQRAEIVAGLYILAGFVAFLQGGAWRSKYLYLLFPLIGFFAKEMAFVFSPLLLLYVMLFEENADLLHFYRAEEFKKCWRSFMKILPSFILTVVFYVFYTKMLPDTFSAGGYDKFKYLITQPMVMCHYIVTYFVPYNLSADTDWTVYNSLSDFRAIAGIVIVFVLVYIALKTSKNKETRLFSFGLLWFFISLLPTSSFIAFSEVLNDHRCFIPYLGLTISFVFGIKYLFEKYFSEAIKQKSTQSFLMVVLILFLGANAYGIRQRNKVWKDGLSLWQDVAIKSPNNGRGLMNYGLALMGRGDFKGAEANFTKAQVLLPDYSTLYINLGILKNATGDKVAAENFYKRSLQCTTTNQSSYYYYGKFLTDQGRDEEAKQNLEKALQIFPNFTEAQMQLLMVYHKLSDWGKMKTLAQNILKSSPEDVNAKKYIDIAINKKSIAVFLEEDAAKSPTPEKYLELSLKYFQMKEFEKCIAAATKAIALKKDFPDAYNNIGIAYVNLQQYDKGIEAYQKAIAINPNYQLAKNNLAYAITMKNGLNTSGTTATLSAADYINLSLSYYNQGKYNECIEASKKSIAISPSANAYNNICTAYNQLKQYDKAIQACNEALKLDTNHNLAKGNLAYAVAQKVKK